MCSTVSGGEETLCGYDSDMVALAVTYNDGSLILQPYREGWWLPTIKTPISHRQTQCKITEQQVNTLEQYLQTEKQVSVHQYDFTLETKRRLVNVQYYTSKSDSYKMQQIIENTKGNWRIFGTCEMQKMRGSSEIVDDLPLQALTQITLDKSQGKVFTQCVITTTNIEQNYKPDGDIGAAMRFIDVKRPHLLRHLYDVFFSFLYPCRVMNEFNFYNFFSPVFRGDCLKLFKSFNRSKSHFITFDDFLLGVLLCDAYNIDNGYLTAELYELRTRLIFAFYTADADGHNSITMTNEEWCDLVSDLKPFKSIKQDLNCAAADAKISIGVDCDQQVRLADLLKNYRNLPHFFDLVLLNHSFIEEVHLTNNIAKPKVENNWGRNEKQRVAAANKRKDFASFDNIRLSPNGNIRTTQRPVGTVEEKPDPCYRPSNNACITKKRCDSLSRTKWLPILDADVAQENESSEGCNCKGHSQSILILHLLMDHLAERIIEKKVDVKHIDKYMTWDDSSSSTWHQSSETYRNFIKLLFEVIPIAKQIFAEEDRIIELCEPTIILGGTNGNVRDLLIYETVFWRNGLGCISEKVLLTGNYVDRGVNSIEAIAYLLAQKILFPNRIFLLRGNHDDREANRISQGNSYMSFLNECQAKLGQDGLRLWSGINDILDMLPIAATVGRRAFVAHSGIPSDDTGIRNTLRIINEVPTPLKSINQNALSRELLWNMPLSESDITEEVQEHLQDGFCGNKRLTGSWESAMKLFNSDAMKKFLNKFGYETFIRQSREDGEEVAYSRQMLEVRSSSIRYNCGRDAHVLLLTREAIKTISIDTSEFSYSPQASVTYPKIQPWSNASCGDNLVLGKVE